MEDKNSLQLISQVLVSRDRKIQNYTYYVILKITSYPDEV